MNQSKPLTQLSMNFETQSLHMSEILNFIYIFKKIQLIVKSFL